MTEQFPAQEDLPGNPFADTTDRHPTDAMLRKFGFRIRERPRDGEPVWERGGKLYFQSVAERIVKNAKKERKAS